MKNIFMFTNKLLEQFALYFELMLGLCYRTFERLFPAAVQVFARAVIIITCFSFVPNLRSQVVH